MGNSPFIVFEDADLDRAAEEAAALKFSNSGQICVNANRFLVQASVYDAFVEKFVAHVERLKLGSGLEATTTLGPMINAKGIEKVQSLIDDALAQGAKLKTGGQHVDGTLFFQPTVLTNMTTNHAHPSRGNFWPSCANFCI